MDTDTGRVGGQEWEREEWVDTGRGNRGTELVLRARTEGFHGDLPGWPAPESHTIDRRAAGWAKTIAQDGQKYRPLACLEVSAVLSLLLSLKCSHAGRTYIP